MSVQALIFDEKYQEGIDNLDRSKELDPLWELPVLKKECTVKLLRGLSHMVAQKGKLKLRKLNNLLKVFIKTWILIHKNALTFVFRLVIEY